MKMWILLIGAILLIGLFFGCTQDQTNTTPEVNNDTDATKIAGEVSTDISGINSALNEIDNSLIEN
jgi:cytochrome oxidase Cu insertion factor (SCO1/SenC/PrrC family)